MKTIFKLTILLLFISFSSCEKEEIIESDVTNNNIGISDNTSVANKGAKNPTYTEAEIFENNLQWVSFLASQAIISDNAARNQFIGEINNNIIDLSQLLDPNLLNQAFKNAFETQFYNYRSTGPCTNGGKPRGVPTPNSCPCSTPENQIFIDYVDELLNDECIEFYISYSTAGGLSVKENGIVSTAHPMNNIDDYNNGYDHSGLCAFEVTVADEAVADAKNNIIVARPYRDFSSCAYSQFSDIPDFTLFLD